MSKKPRGDSKFLNLDEDVQEQIIEIVRKAPSLDEALPVIAEKFGVKSSRSGLSAFWGQWHLRNRFKTYARESDETVKLLKEISGTTLSDQQVSQFAQRFFEVKSLKEDDPKMFAMLQANNLYERSLALREKEIALKREGLLQRIREYEEKVASAKVTLQTAVTKGGLDKETLATIEGALKLL